MATFLLEIGSEELPARFLKRQEEAAVNLFSKALAEAGVSFDSITARSTPRRLAIVISGLSENQAIKEEDIVGPAASIAYDAAGQPTKALEGFCRGNQIELENVFVRATPKGKYVYGRKSSGGKKTKELLAIMTPEIIQQLPFAKKMRWGANQLAYARPIHWLLALLDDQVVDFRLDQVNSNNQTYGHRVHGPGPFTVLNPEQYEQILSNQGHIRLDARDRRQTIIETGDRLAKDKNGKILWNDALLDEVSGLVECPIPVLADFDSEYLEIPAEVLLTSMQTHQKSFGVAGENGKLLPHFLTVLNTDPDNLEIVRQGWQKVLKARLEDARFFWQLDTRDNFEHWLQKLENVIFIGPLGSMGAKSRRLESLCRWLARKIGGVNPAEAARAGRLAKADLVSGMVGEFDSLQGIMGGIYAARAGESAVVAKAIGEQYLPQGPDSPLPDSRLGAILAIADKADTLAGCFGLDMIPTGMADPNGLRRCALGIIRILLALNSQLQLHELFFEAINAYGDQQWKLPPEEALCKLDEFVSLRMRGYFLSLGFDTVIVDAVLSANADNPFDCLARIEALSEFKQQTEFAEASQLLKRITNILKKQDPHNIPASWDANLLKENAEKELSATLDSLLSQIQSANEKGDYGQSLKILAQLNKPVANFFDNVMVMTDDEDLRNNRLALLLSIHKSFAPIADFTLLQI